MKKLDTNQQLLNVLNFLAPGEVKKNPLLASAIVADEKEPSLDDMPTDEEMKEELPADDTTTLEDAPVDEESETLDEQPVENTLDTEEDLGSSEEKETVGPYDLTFHLRKIISAFDQVVKEAEQLRKQTENITANMSPDQQASWIEQRRFFIETAKEAETKWAEFKKVLLNFSLTPKI